MSTNHTPEPWNKWSDSGAVTIWGPQGDCVAVNNGCSCDNDSNADHIVACVNACAGINPEAVPDVVAALRDMLEGYERLLAQSVLDVNPGANRYSIAARAALAKMEDVG
jgi:hypothetical protein